MNSKFIKPYAEWAASIIELLGITIIVLFSLIALIHALYQLSFKVDTRHIYLSLRQGLGKSILLGLEFLVNGHGNLKQRPKSAKSPKDNIFDPNCC